MPNRAADIFIWPEYDSARILCLDLRRQMEQGMNSGVGEQIVMPVCFLPLCRLAGLKGADRGCISREEAGGVVDGSLSFFKGLMLIPCLYLQTCMNINEIKRKRCAIFIRLDKHFWALVRSEQGSRQAPALARATRAGEADVLNCQEDLPACHPQDCGSSPPRGLKNTLHASCVSPHFRACPITSLPHCRRRTSFSQVAASPIFVFPAATFYNLKMQMRRLL